MWANFHTHSSYCDGKTGLTELLDEAVTRNMISLGFSSHAPLPFDTPWAMRGNRLADYLQEISLLKAASSKVQVYAGLEIDFVPGKISPASFGSQLDYTIGSIHFVDEYPNGGPWEIDNTNAVFMDGLDKIFKGNVRDGITRYFELTRQMIEQCRPDVLGHMDKIKIQNTNGKLFTETDTWYRQEIMKTIEAIRKNEIIVEINTRGIYQKKSELPYPSPWIIELLFENNVQVMLSSDAHHPKDLTNCFADTAKLLSQIGYKNLMIIHDGTWQSHGFNECGLT